MVVVSGVAVYHTAASVEVFGRLDEGHPGGAGWLVEE